MNFKALEVSINSINWNLILRIILDIGYWILNIGYWIIGLSKG